MRGQHPYLSPSVPGGETLSPREQGLKGRGDKGVPSWLWCVGGSNRAGFNREQLCRRVHVRASESHAQSQDLASLSALPHSIYQPCHSGMFFLFFFFFLFLFIFISPQMSIFPDLSNACSAAGGEEGAFALSLSLPLASSAPAALLASFYFLQS